MAAINKSVRIKAPLAKVFRVVTDPENWTRYVTSLVSVKQLSKDAPAKGSTFSWQYKMMGVMFSGKGEVTENVSNKRFGLMLKGKATIRESYEFMKNDDGTSTLKINIEHDMPNALLDKMMDNAIVRKLNSIECGNVLKNIKVICES